MYVGAWKSYEEPLKKAGLSMVDAGDLVGEVWDEIGGRPPAADNTVFPLELKFSGEFSAI